MLFVEEVLTLLGFECYRMPSGDIDGVGKDALVNNLYAKIGEGKTLCFEFLDKKLEHLILVVLGKSKDLN